MQLFQGTPKALNPALGGVSVGEPLPFPEAGLPDVPQGTQAIPDAPASQSYTPPSGPPLPNPIATPATTPASPPESALLAAQLQKMDAPPSTKESLLEAVAKFAPTALSAAFGGLPAAAGAAQGVSAGLAQMQAEKDRQNQSLIAQVEAARGREQQFNEFGQTLQENKAKLDQEGQTAQALEAGRNTRSAATISAADERARLLQDAENARQAALLKNNGPGARTPEGIAATIAEAQQKSTIPQQPQGIQQPVSGRDVPLPAAVAIQREEISRAGKNPPADIGTWSLQEDKNGKPILFNSKTSETKPVEGLQRSGTAAKEAAAKEKETGPATMAITYARDYLKNGAFTGPGDEALQEKFFELAKPATGFRMTQPQMDMLQNSRGWMSSLSAKARHAISGTWFSDDQRKQIVNTMEDLAKAKLGSPAAVSSGAGGWTVKVVK